MTQIGSPLWRWKNRPSRRQTVTLGGIDVVFEARLDGGGRGFGQDFIRVIGELGPVDRLAEWCAGPGFIGFSLYGHGLCKELDLLEVNPAAVAVERITLRRNKVPGRAYLSDCFDQVGRAHWDLIVANPPHLSTDEVLPWAPPLTYRDLGWAIHRKFYSQVAYHLRPGGRIVMQENPLYSSVADFEPMIAAGGLTVESVLPSPGGEMYYLVVRALRP